MKKNRFIKLRLIWGIIRDRTVVYNATITPEGLQIRTTKCVIVNNTFNMTNVKNKSGEVRYG